MREIPSPEEMCRQLEEENWRKVGSVIWCNPFGAMFYGPARAWKEMRKSVYGEVWD